MAISLMDLTGRAVGDIYRRSGMNPGNHVLSLSCKRSGAWDVFSEASDEWQGACRNDHDTGIIRG